MPLQLSAACIRDALFFFPAWAMITQKKQVTREHAGKDACSVILVTLVALDCRPCTNNPTTASRQHTSITPMTIVEVMSRSYSSTSSVGTDVAWEK